MKKILVLLMTAMSVGCLACEGKNYDQFDFWIGQWQVTLPDGKVAGINKITQQLNNCVIHESYSTTSGYQGQSVNIYDAVFDKWHQTWVDNNGTLLELNGGLVGDNMVLQGAGKNQQSQPLIHRITWTPNQDGTVRQHWQNSSDDGKSWSTLFDGLYTRLTISSTQLTRSKQSEK